MKGKVTASVIENDVYVEPVLNQTKGGNAWCLDRPMAGRKYLEIDLGGVYRVSALYFHRTLGNPRTNFSRYLLMFKVNNNTSWKGYRIALGGKKLKVRRQRSW